MNAVVRRHQGVVEVALPGLRLPNPLNGQHGHWACRARNRAQVRNVVLMATRQRVRDMALPVVVTVTRIAASSGLDPHDGLPASCKPVVDAIAEAFGVDDRDPRVTWRYDQRRGKRYGCEIRIEPRQQAPQLATEAEDGRRDAAE